MPHMPQVDINSSSGPTQEEAEKGLGLKGWTLISKAIEYSESDQGKAFVAAASTMKGSYDLLDVRNLNPKRAGVYITAVSVSKAMNFAGISTKEQAISCVIAATKLGSSFAAAAALGSTGIGWAAAVPLVMVALESHDVGKQCFLKDGKVAFALN